MSRDASVLALHLVPRLLHCQCSQLQLCRLFTKCSTLATNTFCICILNLCRCYSLMLREMCATWHEQLFTKFPMQPEFLCCWMPITILQTTILQQALFNQMTIHLNDLADLLTMWCQMTCPGSSTSKETLELCLSDPK